MSGWDREVRGFEDKWLARLAWEAGRQSYCPAGILNDEDRTEREWQSAWSKICDQRISQPQPQPTPSKQEKM